MYSILYEYKVIGQMLWKVDHHWDLDKQLIVSFVAVYERLHVLQLTHRVGVLIVLCLPLAGRLRRIRIKSLKLELFLQLKRTVLFNHFCTELQTLCQSIVIHHAAKTDFLHQFASPNGIWYFSIVADFFDNSQGSNVMYLYFYLNKV